MSTQTIPAGGFALKAKKADCLKFSRRGPLRSSVPAHIDGHKLEIVEVSSHQGPRGGLNTDPVIARNGRTTPRRASQSAGGARSGNATPNGTGTPRRASVVVSPTGSPYITGLTSTPSSTPVRAGLYDRSPARYAAPPLTANQQHLIAARSGRSVSPSDPNFNLLHSSSGEPHNNHHLHSAESTDGGEYQLDAVTVKYDPIALLLHGGIVNTTGTGGHNGGGRRNTRNLSPSANASATEVHDNVAARHRRTHAISLERAIEADQRQQSNLNTGIIRNTIKEMRRSVSPTTCGLAKSTFGAASVGPASPLKGGYIAGLSTTTNVPAPVGTRNDVITSPSYKLRKEPFSGDLYASPSSSLSSPQRRYDAANVSTASGASSPSKRGVADTTPNGRGANVSTCSVNASSISQSTTTKGPHVSHANNSTHNNGSRSPSANSRRVVTPRGTVTTSDYGTSVAYEPLTGSAAKESPRRDAALSHRSEAAEKTPVKGGEVDGQPTEGANDAPQTVPLQHPGFFTKEKLHGTEDASPAAVEDSRV